MAKNALEKRHSLQEMGKLDTQYTRLKTDSYTKVNSGGSKSETIKLPGEDRRNSSRHQYRQVFLRQDSKSTGNKQMGKQD